MLNAARWARFDQRGSCLNFISARWKPRLLNESFELLGKSARAKPCNGMEGLVDEGSEVMPEGEDKEDAAADLALIGAAQRVEHYEIAGYTAARNLAGQLRHSAIVALLTKSLAEEENADQLLNQVVRSLMSVARMPASIKQASLEELNNRGQKSGPSRKAGPVLSRRFRTEVSRPPL
jgi:Mn-containing catalase